MNSSFLFRDQLLLTGKGEGATKRERVGRFYSTNIGRDGKRYSHAEAEKGHNRLLRSKKSFPGIGAKVSDPSFSYVVALPPL